MRTVLLIGGTREARELAAAWPFEDARLVASLAGATRDPLPYACETRNGGFGGVAGLVEWLRAEDVTAIIDASHPFAEGIAANVQTAAGRLKLPLVVLRRAAWTTGANWREFASLAELAQAIPARATVFLTTGRGDLAPFVDRTDVRFILRSIETPPELPQHVRSVLGRPPFTQPDEEAFMRDHGITHLVTKNAGGERPAKLAAASAVGCLIFSVSMPKPSTTEQVEGVTDALDWVAKAL